MCGTSSRTSETGAMGCRALTSRGGLFAHGTGWWWLMNQEWGAEVASERGGLRQKEAQRELRDTVTHGEIVPAQAQGHPQEEPAWRGSFAHSVTCQLLLTVLPGHCWWEISSEHQRWTLTLHVLQRKPCLEFPRRDVGSARGNGQERTHPWTKNNSKKPGGTRL